MTSSRCLPAIALVGLVASASCAGHRVVHDAPDESRPHITWNLRTGGAEGDERLLCDSTQGPPKCTVDAAPSPGTRASVTFHFYMHGAAKVATYEGTLALPFFDGAEERAPRPIRATVKPGAEAEGLSVSGLVTRKPGTYTLRINLKTTLDGKPSVALARELPVVVR